MADVLRPGRRTLLRALAASPLLLLVPPPLAAAQSTSGLGSADLAAGSYGPGDLDTTSAPDWMRHIADTTPLAALSLPGTHDTMAHNSSIPELTQDCDLATQLRAGVRAIDIRTRHFRDAFPIHHGPEHLHANFTDVVRTVTDVLRTNPSETVLMLLKKKHTEEAGLHRHRPVRPRPARAWTSRTTSSCPDSRRSWPSETRPASSSSGRPWANRKRCSSTT